MHIRVSIEIDASVAEVWEQIQDISSHRDWMKDARSIEFLSDQQQGAGTRFVCETKVGPIVLKDVMEVFEWTPGHRMGVRHRGLVSGEGLFELTRRSDSKTCFEWEEVLKFPWKLGGVVGEFAAKPVLVAIWKGNLKRLKRQIESRG